MEPIVNRIAQSDIEVVDLESLMHSSEPVELDLAPFLYKGLIVREKAFREAVRETDWSAYEGRLVHITCSVDTIIPPWVYMLIASRLEAIAEMTVVGDAQTAHLAWFSRQIGAHDWSIYEGRIVVVKGCGALNVPQSAYSMVMGALQAVARKVMYGEPCSSVPIWRKPKSDPAA